MHEVLPLDIIPIEVAGYHIVTTIAINDIEVRMVVDTGASQSVVDLNRLSRFSNREAEKITDRHSTGLGTNDMEMHSFTADSIMIGASRIHHFSLIALDLTHINNAYRQLGAPEVDGVIGNDILVKAKAVIDYSQKSLSLNLLELS